MEYLGSNHQSRFWCNIFIVRATKLQVNRLYFSINLRIEFIWSFIGKNLVFRWFYTYAKSFGFFSNAVVRQCLVLDSFELLHLDYSDWSWVRNDPKPILLRLYALSPCSDVEQSWAVLVVILWLFDMTLHRCLTKVMLVKSLHVTVRLSFIREFKRFRSNQRMLSYQACSLTLVF